MVGLETKSSSLVTIWHLLSSIPDPEVPCITIKDLGIIRNVIVLEKKIIVELTPTYSGCPAVNAIEIAVKDKLKNNGFDATIKRVLSPPWTSDWITKEGRQKLKDYGIAPPTQNSPNENEFFSIKPVQCPKCDSFKTSKISHFGSTACKAQFSCNSCLEPFELFKCI